MNEEELLEVFFASSDKDLNKMGILLCHKLRINYYVLVMKSLFTGKSRTINYFLGDDSAEELRDLINNKGVSPIMKIHKIVLNKTGVHGNTDERV